MADAILQGPIPSGPLGFCLICTGIAKDRAMGPALTREITEHERLPAGTAPARNFPLRLASPPQPAVAWGLVPAFSALAPLCWTHLPRLSQSGSGIIPVQGALPPPPMAGRSTSTGRTSHPPPPQA